jgi:hypothetical protein
LQLEKKNLDTNMKYNMHLKGLGSHHLLLGLKKTV